MDSSVPTATAVELVQSPAGEPNTIIGHLFNMQSFIFVAFLLIALIIFWLIPIILGTRAAKQKGISPYWMLFAIHPFFGWIAFIVIRFAIDRRTICPECKEMVKMGASICKHCKTKITNQAITD